MRAADLVTAALLALVGLIVIADALRLGIGWGTDGPKSGFFPFWLAVIMVATLSAILVRTLLGGVRTPFVTRDRLGPVLRVFGPAVAFVVLTQGLGLYLSGALYVGTSMRWIGRHGWAAVLGVAVGVPLVAFVVFERWFLVPMPKGPLETWLGY